ncbi:MAG: phosphoglycerate dehydrogenase [Coriobacteriales bacterium]|jgi:D-3-phosphoglycerate dehydrogenase
MKVLVADKIADKGIKILEDNGYDVDVNTGQPEDVLISIIPQYEAMIVRSQTTVTRAIIEAGTKLKIIGRAGVGVDNVDIEAATEKGVIVCNAPTSNVISAAEQTMALMLAISRKTVAANNSMQNGKWERSKFKGNELYEKTLAIFGLGRVGGLVAERAKSFGMRLIGYDPYCSPDRAEQLGVEVYDNIDEMIPQADYITVHLPKTKETIGMFGEHEFSLMKPTVFLINAARGGIYDVDVLAKYAKEGKIAGAAIDVYEKEPCTESPLHGLDNVILTPHLGANTKEAQDRAGYQIAEFVMDGLQDKMVPTALNMTRVPDDVMDAVGPYIGACQTAGHILTQLAPDSITSLQVTVFGELTKLDTRILGTAALQGIISETTDERVNFVNAEHLADEKGINFWMSSEEKSSYTSMVMLRGRAGDKEVEVAVTADSNGEVRIVDLFGYKFDMALSENTLIMQYLDGPGRLAKICPVLGDANINISTMQVSDGGKDKDVATVAFNLDEACSESVREKLAAALDEYDLRGIWFIRL